MLILLCYQERHGLCYQLIYWKSSPESIRFLIVSWTSKTEEKWMSLGLPGVPADHCGFLGTDFQLIQMRPERQLLQIHAVGPAAQRWLTERLGGGGRPNISSQQVVKFTVLLNRCYRRGPAYMPTEADGASGQISVPCSQGCALQDWGIGLLWAGGWDRERHSLAAGKIHLSHQLWAGFQQKT